MAQRMRRVLHLGPVQSRGGMQATIRHHLRHPPPRWKCESINTHVDGSAWAKLMAWRTAKRELKQMLGDSPPDLVHIHTATRYSWWRKSRATRMCIAHDIPTVLQVHAGNFHLYLSNRPKALADFMKLAAHPLVTTVALTPRHKRELGLGDMAVIGSPAPPVKEVDPSTRDRNLMVLLARPSPVKGHRLAISVIQELRSRGRDVHLHLSGLTPSHPWVSGFGPEQGIHARGWLSGEEKEQLLESAGMLLIPSKYEGMPVAAMEALSCGLPVVASSACEGILGGGGVIIRSLEAEDWVENLESLLDDEARWEEMSIQGPMAVRNQTPDRLGERWARLYESAIKVVKE